MINSIINGDCLEAMKEIKTGSVDMILCDLPYGTTACKWDTIIPFKPLWDQYERIIKDNGAIVLFSSQPFTTNLINSNIKKYKYSWIWNKGTGTNFQQVKRQPMRYTEDICIFSNKPHQYYPIMELREKPKDYTNSKTLRSKNKNINHFNSDETKLNVLRVEKYPSNIISISSQQSECNNLNRIHPTQKPVALFEYLIKTYSQEGQTILDNCAGSGTTAIAAINTNRNYICIEKDEHYHSMSVERVKEHNKQLSLEI